MPRLRYARSSAAEAAGSSPGTSRGSASTTVTSTPNERQADANSTPITPPPSTIAEAGSGLQPQRVVAGHHPVAVDLDARQRLGVRPGREHHVRRRSALAVPVADRDRRRRRPRTTSRPRPPPPRCRGRRPARSGPCEPADHAVGVRPDAGQVDPVEGGVHPERPRRGPRRPPRRRAGSPWSGCSPVQAGAADQVALDQRDPQPELGRAQRAGVPAAARTEHHEVERVVRSSPASCPPGRGQARPRGSRAPSSAHPVVGSRPP